MNSRNFREANSVQPDGSPRSGLTRLDSVSQRSESSLPRSQPFGSMRFVRVVGDSPAEEEMRAIRSLLPQSTQTAQQPRRDASAAQRNTYEPLARMVIQLVSDKVDLLTDFSRADVNHRVENDKAFVRTVVEYFFDEALCKSKELQMAVGEAGISPLGASDPVSFARDPRLETIRPAVRIVHFRMFEGYCVWHRDVHGLDPWPPADWDDNGDHRGLVVPDFGDERLLGVDNLDATLKQLRDLVLFTLLRAVSGTVNHAPEVMNLMLCAVLDTNGSTSAWADVFALLKALYNQLGSSPAGLSLDDFNKAALDKDATPRSLATLKFSKTFAERGGLHVLIANYCWLIRMLLWVWILGWYMQPVHIGRPVCVNDALDELAKYDTSVNVVASLSTMQMTVGTAAMRRTFLAATGQFVSHVVLFCIFVFNPSLFADIEVEMQYGLKLGASFVYAAIWVIIALLLETWRFSIGAFGEHRVRGSLLKTRYAPRKAMGVTLAGSLIYACYVSYTATEGGNAWTANVALGLFESKFWIPFLAIIGAVFAATIMSYIVGFLVRDRHGVEPFPRVLFWVVFAAALVLLNIFWLVPSVTNLQFSICECQMARLHLSSETCDWRSQLSCRVAVILTWTATFFVAFVVAYGLFIACSLVSGIVTAKWNHIGAVRDWDDVELFGTDVVLHHSRCLSDAAEDPDVARELWNAMIASMFRDHLLSLTERDAYLFHLSGQRFFTQLGSFFAGNPPDAEARLARSVVEQVGNGDIAALRRRSADATRNASLESLLLVRAAIEALAPFGFEADDPPPGPTVNFAKLLFQQLVAPIKGIDVEAHRALAELRKDEDFAFIMPLLHNCATAEQIKSLLKSRSDALKSLIEEQSNALKAADTRVDERSRKVLMDEVAALEAVQRGCADRQKLAAAVGVLQTTDLRVPPRCPEAARRIIHYLWSLECGAKDVARREKETAQSRGGKAAAAGSIADRRAHRVATMPSCTTIIPYYAEGVMYEFEDVIKTYDEGDNRASTLEYIAAQYPEEWTNFVHDEVRRAKMSLPKKAKDVPGFMSDFMEKCLRGGPEVPKEQRDRLCAFVTNRGQTLGRTLRGVEALRKGLKALAFFEECDRVQNETAEATAERVGTLVDSKYQVIVAAQVYTPCHLRTTLTGGSSDDARDQRLRDEQLDRLQKVLTFDIVCNDDSTCRSYFVPKSNPSWPTWIVRPGPLRVSAKRPTEPKPENQLHAVPFAFGEVLNAFDMNQDDTVENGFKQAALLSIYWNPPPEAMRPGCRELQLFTPKFRIVGFAEHTYTRPLSLVGELMGAAEFCFVTITQRVLAKPLGVRAHYGHPDYVDGYWARTRGGMSKSSHVVNVNEDIFCGYEMISRGQKITFVEWRQAQKGRESAFTPAFVFESKLAGGAGQQVRSRDVFFLNQNLDIFSRLSVVFGTLGFYIVNFLMGASVHYFMWAIILFRVSDTSFHHLGTVQAKIAVAWVFQLGYVLAFPLLIENVVEHGILRGIQAFLRTIIPSIFFFVFHLQTKFHYFCESILRGKAGYKATGRGFCLDRESLKQVYVTYGSSHITEALRYLILLMIYRYLSDEPAFSFVLRCLTVIFIVISWFGAPLLFQPFPTFQRLQRDWNELWSWYTMPARRGSCDLNDGAHSWQAWLAKDMVDYWQDEETYFVGPQVALISILRLAVEYVPYFCVFLNYVSDGAGYLMLLLALLQLLYAMLLSSIDKSQHHHLTVVELLVAAVGLPALLIYYFVVAADESRISDVLFGALMYFTLLSFAAEAITVFRRQLYRLRFWSAPPDDAKVKQARAEIALFLVSFRRPTALVCMTILFVVSWVLCFVRAPITAFNYSSAAAFAWERAVFGGRAAHPTTSPTVAASAPPVTAPEVPKPLLAVAANEAPPAIPSRASPPRVDFGPDLRTEVTVNTFDSDDDDNDGDRASPLRPSSSPGTGVNVERLRSEAVLRQMKSWMPSSGDGSFVSRRTPSGLASFRAILSAPVDANPLDVPLTRGSKKASDDDFL